MNTQALLFEGCGNVKEKLRKKSKNLSGEPAGAELRGHAHCPCPVWGLAMSGNCGADSQPFHGSLEQRLDELPNVSTTIIKRLKTQPFVLRVTESSELNPFGNTKEKALVTEQELLISTYRDSFSGKCPFQEMSQRSESVSAVPHEADLQL